MIATFQHRAGGRYYWKTFYYDHEGEAVEDTMSVGAEYFWATAGMSFVDA